MLLLFVPFFFIQLFNLMLSILWNVLFDVCRPLNVFFFYYFSLRKRIHWNSFLNFIETLFTERDIVIRMFFCFFFMLTSFVFGVGLSDVHNLMTFSWPWEQWESALQVNIDEKEKNRQKYSTHWLKSTHVKIDWRKTNESVNIVSEEKIYWHLPHCTLCAIELELEK